MDMNQMQNQPGGAPVSPPGVMDSMPPGLEGGMPPEGMPENGGMMPMPEPPMEEPMPEPPMEEEEPAASAPNKTDGLKKELLQKLMSNLLSKPGRSVHELVNGVKDVLGAYKNYSKEIDNLSGITEASISPTSSEGGEEEIQSILAKIEAAKAGQGEEPMPTEGGDSWTPPPPTGAPMSPEEGAIAPESQMMPPGGVGGPGYSKTGYTQPPPVSRLGIWGY